MDPVPVRAVAGRGDTCSSGEEPAAAEASHPPCRSENVDVDVRATGIRIDL